MFFFDKTKRLIFGIAYVESTFYIFLQDLILKKLRCKLYRKLMRYG